MIRKLTSVAKTLPAEDICPGEYVALLSITYQYPSYLWPSDVSLLPAREPISIEWLCTMDDSPFLVKSVCLPFVFVASPKGEHETIDVRRTKLCRIDRDHGELVWEAFKVDRKKADSSTKKSSKKKKKKSRK